MGGGAHYANLPHRLNNQGQALTCDYFFHFTVNAWSVVSGETNSCHREPETRHVKESKECQERRINQQLTQWKFCCGPKALSKVQSNYFIKKIDWSSQEVSLETLLLFFLLVCRHCPSPCGCECDARFTELP